MDHGDGRKFKIAVVIPCYNEEVTIGRVISDFRKYLPDASIYVYDNNSTDRTKEVAREYGAIVFKEKRQGKGNVIRSAFRNIEADFYFIVDGDATYDASIAPMMLQEAIENQYDLVNCIRNPVESSVYRPGHAFGNILLTKVVNIIFGNYIKDMLSGYKLLSRRFVKSFPIQSNGFDIETEIAIHALQMQCNIGHVKGNYYERPSGSYSKLKTFRDGIRILKLILQLFRHERPLLFFSSIGFIMVIISLILGLPVVYYYLQTGLVPRLPTAILSMGIMIIAFLSFLAGIVLDTITKGRIENKMLVYLNQPNIYDFYFIKEDKDGLQR